MKKKLSQILVILLLFGICVGLYFLTNLICFKYKQTKPTISPISTYVPETIQKGFRISSTMEEVIKYMGTPTDKSVYEKEGEEVWYYNKSRVYFKYGKVYNFDNCDNNLILYGKEIQD